MKYSDPILCGFSGVLMAGAVLAQASAVETREAAVPVVVREIADVSSGARWLLVKDTANPGAPGRLIQLREEAAPASMRAVFPAPAPTPLIHAGDRILVEEHTGVVDAVLEAVALGTAGENSALRARLRVGGRVVRTVAVAPGRARLAAAAEDRP